MKLNLHDTDTIVNIAKSLENNNDFFENNAELELDINMKLASVENSKISTEMTMIILNSYYKSIRFVKNLIIRISYPDNQEFVVEYQQGELAVRNSFQYFAFVPELLAFLNEFTESHVIETLRLRTEHCQKINLTNCYTMHLETNLKKNEMLSLIELISKLKCKSLTLSLKDYDDVSLAEVEAIF